MLFRTSGSGIAFNPNNNTEAHAVCIYAYAHTYLIIHTYGHLVSHCFGLAMNLPDSMCQNKARKTPLSICPVYHPPERHIPSARAQYGKTFLATRARLFRSAVQRYNIFLIYTRVNCIFFEFSSKGHKKTDRCPLFTLSLLTVDVLRQ